MLDSRTGKIYVALVCTNSPALCGLVRGAMFMHCISLQYDLHAIYRSVYISTYKMMCQHKMLGISKGQ